MAILTVCFPTPLLRLDYCDEAVKDPEQALPVDIHQPPPFVHKILQLSGVLFYYEDFSEGSGSAPSPVPKVCPRGADPKPDTPLLPPTPGPSGFIHPQPAARGGSHGLAHSGRSETTRHPCHGCRLAVFRNTLIFSRSLRRKRSHLPAEKRRPPPALCFRSAAAPDTQR